MILTDDVVYGVTGTALGAVGAGLSVTEIQAIVSIVVTVLSFIIGVLVPVIIKIVKKIKEAKKDGVITREEKSEIISEINRGAQEIKEGSKEIVKQVSDKIQKKE